MSAYTSLKQKVFNIESSEKVSGARSDAFEVKTSMPHSNNFDKVALVEADIPKSYYMLDSDDTFTLYEPTGTQSTTVTISGGRNYTASELATALKTALDTASATGSNSFTYTVTFATTTGKFTIAGSDDFEFRLSGKPLLAKYLGMEADDTSNVASSSSLTSGNIVNLQRYDVIVIKSSLANNSGNDVLGRIYPSATAYLTNIHFSEADPRLTSVGLANNATNVSGFCLQDVDNNSINLNGLEWRCKVVAFKDSEKSDI